MRMRCCMRVTCATAVTFFHQIRDGCIKPMMLGTVRSAPKLGGGNKK